MAEPEPFAARASEQLSPRRRDAFYWRLIYPYRAILEPPEHASIREAPRGATGLEIARADGATIARVELRGYRPVFYRKHSVGLDLTDARVDASVFGRARDTGSQIDVALWAIVGGRLVVCPPHLLDDQMVRLQILDP